MKFYDVAVIGAGPAGSVCAEELAKSGIKVALFDPSHPREKPCGGGLEWRAAINFDIPKNMCENEVDWFTVENQRGDRVKLKHKLAGFMVMRKKFDSYLLQRALNSGPDFYKERVIDIKGAAGSWVIETNKNIISAGTIIGADGCPSIVRNIVYEPIPKEHLAQCVGYYIPLDSKHISKEFIHGMELYFLGPPYFNAGYVWIFPKKDNINIGVGAKVGKYNLTKVLNYFIKNHDAAKRIEVPKNIKLYSHLVPFVSDPNFYDLPTSGDGWALIGDAAGHVNSITGEGIYYAMSGGRLAAKAYIDGDITQYEKMWRKDFGEELYTAAKLQKWVYTPIVINSLVILAKYNNFFRGLLYNMVAHQKYKEG